VNAIVACPWKEGGLSSYGGDSINRLDEVAGYEVTAANIS
jgi:hypothetical protein